MLTSLTMMLGSTHTTLLTVTSSTCLTRRPSCSFSVQAPRAKPSASKDVLNPHHTMEHKTVVNQQQATAVK